MEETKGLPWLFIGIALALLWPHMRQFSLPFSVFFFLVLAFSLWGCGGVTQDSGISSTSILDFADDDNGEVLSFVFLVWEECSLDSEDQEVGVPSSGDNSASPILGNLGFKVNDSNETSNDTYTETDDEKTADVVCGQCHKYVEALEQYAGGGNLQAAIDELLEFAKDSEDLSLMIKYSVKICAAKLEHHFGDDPGDYL